MILIYHFNVFHFYYLATQYSDIINWGIKNKVWQGFFNFAIDIFGIR